MDDHRRAELIRGTKAAALGAAIGALLLFLARRAQAGSRA
jgi:hypothetical protein